MEPAPALPRLRELNLGYAVKLPVEWIHTVLKGSGSLLSVVLRGIATDEALRCLSASCLRLQTSDFGFSNLVTDEGIEALIQACSKLERCNIRACPKVSRGLYNRLPTILSHRGSGAATGATDHGFFYLKN